MWEQVFTTVTFVHALSTVFSRSIIVPETQHSAPLVIECYFRPKVEGTRKKGIFWREKAQHEFHGRFYQAQWTPGYGRFDFLSAV